MVHSSCSILHSAPHVSWAGGALQVLGLTENRMGPCGVRPRGQDSRAPHTQRGEQNEGHPQGERSQGPSGAMCGMLEAAVPGACSWVPMGARPCGWHSSQGPCIIACQGARPGTQVHCQPQPQGSPGPQLLWPAPQPCPLGAAPRDPLSQPCGSPAPRPARAPVLLRERFPLE